MRPVASHLRLVPPATERRPSGLAPDVEARVIDLPDTLRAWAREETLAWFFLNRHVAHGAPLTDCLADLVRTLGDEGLPEVRARLADTDRADLRAWCSPQPACPIAPLVTELALPDDPALDAFASGDAEVDDYFRGRAWFNAAKGAHAPPTYAFRAADNRPVIGFASVAFRKVPHPVDASPERASYLTIYAVGVNLAYQGVRNPAAPAESYATSILRVVEGLARQHADCVGLSLWVRADNARAIAFYRRVGFVADPGGAVHRDEGAPHRTMRKALR